MVLTGALAGQDKNEEFKKKKFQIKHELEKIMMVHVEEYDVSIVAIINCEMIPNKSEVKG